MHAAHRPRTITNAPERASTVDVQAKISKNALTGHPHCIILPISCLLIGTLLERDRTVCCCYEPSIIVIHDERPSCTPKMTVPRMECRSICVDSARQITISRTVDPVYASISRI
eukprot:9477326-Pyramimonas_sp.AAC.2